LFWAHFQAWSRSVPKYRPLFRQEQALRHIAAVCRSGAGIPFLPPVRELAKGAGVSHETMLAALHRACADGTLIAHGRRGFTPNGVSPEQPAHGNVARRTASLPPAVPVPRSISVAQQLCGDIIAGTYPPGSSLPTAKELRARLGAGHAAIRAALGDLASRSLIMRHGRGWRVFTRTAARSRATFALIAPTPHFTHLINTSPWSMEFCQALTQECNRLNLAMEVYGMDEAAGSGRDPHARIRNILDHARRRAIMGFAVYALAPRPDPLFEALVGLLERTGKPTAILDDFGTLGSAMRPAPGGLVRFFTRSSAHDSGLRMGRYLLSLGHRRIAYISEWSPDPIFDARGDGLQRALLDAGITDGIATFSAGPYEPIRPHGPHAPNRALLLRAMNALKSSEGIHPSPDNLGGLYLRSLDFMARNALSDIVELGACADRLVPVFNRVFEQQGITALAGSSDRVALLGYALALDRGIRVPAQLSITGFDDWLPSVSNGITSFNFNVATIVRRMMDFVMSAKRGSSADRTSTIETAGFVVQRRSCAAAHP
jgi:DNA-binding LacI/PurR family transcriptional regulator